MAEAKVKAIKINCQGADKKKLDALLDFQGDLKVLTEENFKKFKAIVLKHGITDPISIWRQKKGKTVKDTGYMLNGHQRVKVLKRLRQEGYRIPELPINYVDAPTRERAKEILLSHVSSYGKVTREGLDMFMLDAGLEMSDMSELMSMENMVFDDLDEGPEIKEEEIKPYNKINVLITFDPVLFAKVSPLLEKIMEIEGVEYEQGTN